MEKQDKGQEISAQIAAFQSVCNLLDWEQQTGSLMGKSCEAFGVREHMQDHLRELLREMHVADSSRNALARELERLRKQEKRWKPGTAKERNRLLTEMGQAWQKVIDEPDETNKPLRAECRRAAGENEKKYLELMQQMAILIRKNGLVYETCLWDYEPCYSLQEIDSFFSRCKKELLPLLKSRLACQEKEGKVWSPDWTYDMDRQKQLNRFLFEYLGFDGNRGMFGESRHPFTTAITRDCVGCSNRYRVEDPFSAIFTALHEAGHGMYEQNVSKSLAGTVLAGGCSDAMQEAVARFYENGIGKCSDFWQPIYTKVQQILGGEWERLPFETFMRRIQYVKPGCDRTDADELTYPFHILIRYELERELMEGTEPVEALVTALSEKWNQKMKEYLGIEPGNAKEGYLQDIHWSAGQFGYFPAYQIGNAIAAQMYLHIKKTMPLKKWLQEGNLETLRDYMTEKVFRYGKTKDTEELLWNMTGEPLQFEYYINYLKERYSNSEIF